MSIVNGPICSSDQSFGDATSSLSAWYITTKGDTIRICTARNPLSDDAGYPGEICFGTVSGITYIYYCIASENWGRAELTTGY